MHELSIWLSLTFLTYYAILFVLFLFIYKQTWPLLFFFFSNFVKYNRKSDHLFWDSLTLHSITCWVCSTWRISSPYLQEMTGSLLDMSPIYIMQIRGNLLLSKFLHTLYWKHFKTKQNNSYCIYSWLVSYTKISNIVIY